MKKPPKKIVIVIAAVMAVILVSVLTVFLLKQTVVKKEATTNGSSTAVSSASDILKNFKISGLDSSSKYSSQTDSASILQYKLDTEVLGISLATNKSTLFVTIDPSKAKDTADIQSQTTSFMEKKGLAVINTTIYNPNKALKYMTYADDTAVCQLMSTDEAISTGQSHLQQLTCVDKKTISDQYNSIKKLLAIGDASRQVAGYAQALITENSKDNIKYSILSLNATGKSQRLLFASVNDKWEYLGDLLGGGKQYATEKGSITPELQAKINNVKYKGFLKASLAEE